jgi:hypothetical protein
VIGPIAELMRHLPTIPCDLRQLARVVKRGFTDAFEDHEGGHALVAMLTPATDPVRNVSIVRDSHVVLANLKPGEKATVAVRTPRGSEESVTITLGQYPGR